MQDYQHKNRLCVNCADYANFNHRGNHMVGYIYQDSNTKCSEDESKKIQD